MGATDIPSLRDLWDRFGDGFYRYVVPTGLGGIRFDAGATDIPSLRDLWDRVGDGFYRYAVPTGLLGSGSMQGLPICRPYGTCGIVLVMVSTDMSSLRDFGDQVRCGGYRYTVPTGLVGSFW